MNDEVERLCDEFVAALGYASVLSIRLNAIIAAVEERMAKKLWATVGEIEEEFAGELAFRTGMRLGAEELAFRVCGDEDVK